MAPAPLPRRPPLLLAISDRHALAPGASAPEQLAALESWIGAMAAAGVTVQLREKDLDDADLYALAVRARALVPPPGRLLINGRPDVALAAGADGVHLPAEGLPAAAVRRRWGGRLAIGVSTHAPEEVEAARRAGAGYAVFGPVFPTPSKPGAALPGLEGLRRAAAAAIPVLALGGVTPERLPELAAAGAAGAAGIRCFRDRAGAEAMVRAARRAFGDRAFAGESLDERPRST